MKINIAQESKSLNLQLIVAFIFFSSVIFSATTLLNSQYLLNTTFTSGTAALDADNQAAKYQTWSDPLIDANESSYVVDALPFEQQFPFEQQIRQVARELGVEESLVYAVTKAESSFRSKVQSNAGAVGLMQVVATAAGRDAYYRLYKKRFTPTKAQLQDPYTNLQLGSTYLKLLEEHYFSHINNQELKHMLVLAAYNWGPVNVKRKILAKNPPRTVAEMKWVLWTKAPKETYRYVNKVLKYQTQFSQFDA